MCSDTSELVPSTAGAKQWYSFLISEWRRAFLSCYCYPWVCVPSSSALFPSSGRQWRPLLRPAKLQINPAPTRFRDCPTWYRVVNTRTPLTRILDGKLLLAHSVCSHSTHLHGLTHSVLLSTHSIRRTSCSTSAVCSMNPTLTMTKQCIHLIPFLLFVCREISLEVSSSFVS
jgi:hypothetical protein